MKLKDKYQGVIITKKVQLKPYQTVSLTFDSTRIKEKDYEKYYKLGFEELFDICDGEDDFDVALLDSLLPQETVDEKVETVIVKGQRGEVIFETVSVEEKDTVQEEPKVKKPRKPRKPKTDGQN